MKRVIPFSNARFVFFAFSAAIMITGIVGYMVNGGFNLGVDFKAGVAIQFQVAPASFSLRYSGQGQGQDRAEVSIPSGEQAITAPGDFIVTLIAQPAGTKQIFPFKYAEYPTIQALADGLAKVQGIEVRLKGDPGIASARLIPPMGIADITLKDFTFNTMPEAGKGEAVGIADIRAILESLGNFDMQIVGNPRNQEFIARVEAKDDSASFQQGTEARVSELLGAKYGADQFMIKKSDFVGPRLAQSLGAQAIWLAVIAVLLILLYMVFRFHPAIYAVAAVLGICHDALAMLAFDAVFRIEVDAATIAAILTILGYSINDTIVIFDRVRENGNLMRGSSLRTVLDTSVSQTLSRTFITSGATLLTVIALFVLTSGSMKNFSLNMLFGIVEGTYSTFISSFLVLQWSNWADKRRKRRELEKYGMGRADRKEEEPESEDEEPEGTAPSLGTEPRAAQAQETGAGGAPVQPMGLTGPEGAGQTSGVEGQPPQGKIVSFPGGQNQAYRHHHKRHKRRHH